MQIPLDLDKDFKEAIMKRYGMKRGNIKMALREAIADWIGKVGQDGVHEPD